jgi:hypothetical protein
MTDAKDQPTSLEDISAGLLNGAMVTLLGGAVAGFIAWQVVAQSWGGIPDLTIMAISLSSADYEDMASHERRALIQDSMSGLGLIIMSLWAIRFGVGLIRENLALLRARRG